MLYRNTWTQLFEVCQLVQEGTPYTKKASTLNLLNNQDNLLKLCG